MDITPRRPAGRLFLSSGLPPEISLPAPEFHHWRELVGQRLVRDWLKKFTSPGRNQAHSEKKISPIKDGDPDQNKT